MTKKYQTSLSDQQIFKHSAFVQHEEIKKNILILPELESLIPPLNKEELEQLETNILDNGCRESLLIWPTTNNIIAENGDSQQVYVLVDGHNRFSICKKHSLDFPIHLVSYNTLEEVRSFMIDNQLGRRNLTPEQGSYLRGMKYLSLKKNKGKYDRSEHNAHFEHYAEKQTTAELLAEQFNVGQATIRRDAAFAQGLENLAPILKSDVLSGKTNLTKSNLQQLGKQEVLNEKIDSEEHVFRRLEEPRKKQDTQEKNDKKRKLLIEQLEKLVNKLKNNYDNNFETCKKIVELSSKLTELKELI